MIDCSNDVDCWYLGQETKNSLSLERESPFVKMLKLSTDRKTELVRTHRMTGITFRDLSIAPSMLWINRYNSSSPECKRYVII